MTARGRKTLWIVLSTLVGLIAVGVVVGIFVAQSQWFRDFVRAKIVSTVEDSTGGKVAIASFGFDWRHLRAEISDFELRGTEPADAQPLLRIQHLAIDLKIASLLKSRKVDIASLTVDQPQVNLIVSPDGKTNIPSPQIKRVSYSNGLQTLVDLAVGRFTINNGSIHLAEQKANFEASGENLQAKLLYEMAGQQYRGQLSMSPLYFQSDGNPRLDVAVNLPVVIGKDRLQLSGATMTTASSKVTISGVLEHLASPVISGGLNAQLNVPEMARTFGLSIPVSDGSLNTLYANAELHSDQNNVQIRQVKVALGQSTLQAFGTMKNLALEKGSLQFSSSLNVKELSTMLASSGEASGTIRMDGTVTTNGLADYAVDASVTGQRLNLRQGNLGMANASMSAKVRATPNNISANPLRAAIAGGRFDGSASLVDGKRYKVQGKLNGFAIEDLLASAGKPAWGGAISGLLQAEGEIGSAKQSGLQAHARLVVTPNNRGVPLSGQLNADFDSRADTLAIGRSYLTFPASRLEFSGSLKDGLDVHLTSASLQDFLPAFALFSQQPPAVLPVKFDRGGSLTLDAHLMGSVHSPEIAGHLAASNFSVEQRHFDQLRTDLTADKSGAAIQNAVLTRGSLSAQLSASVGLDQWKMQPAGPLKANVVVRNADVQDVLALAGQSQLPICGDLALSAQASGTIGNPQGRADLTIVNGSAYQQPFDRVQGQMTYGGRFVSIPNAHATAGDAMANLTATFEHPLNVFSTGRLRVHLDTNQVALDRLAALHAQRPDLGGLAQTNLDAEATLQASGGGSTLQVTALNGNVNVRGLRARGRMLGDFTADARTTGNQIAYRAQCNFAGSSTSADGTTTLTADYPTVANVSIQTLPLEQALGLAGRDEIQARGLFSAKGDVSGTLRDPHADLQVGLTKAVLYKQPLERVEAHVNYSNVLIEVPSAKVSLGRNSLELAGSFSHPSQTFTTGDLRLHMATDSVQLAQLQYVQEQRPGLAGLLKVDLDGTASLDHAASGLRILPTSMKGSVSANNLRLNGRDYGDFNATAKQSGSTLAVDLDSTLAQSMIHAKLQAQLGGEYKTSGQLDFKNVRYSNWNDLLGVNTSAGGETFDAVADGGFNGSVAILQPKTLSGSGRLTKLEISAKPKTVLAASLSGTRSNTLALRNDGPIEVTASSSEIKIQKASLIGNSTHLTLTGGVALQPAVALNLTVDADANLALLQDLDPEISSDGKLTVNARIQGPLRAPTVNGRLQLKDAAFQTENMSNGISKANGVIQFTGGTARIENLTAESGGGKITISGFAGRTGSTFRYGLAARASQVRVREESGVSVVGNANVRLTGTSQNSLLSGNINIVSVKFNPQTDFGSILASSAPPTESSSGGALSSMKLDLDVRTAPGASFQTSIAENLRAQATLNVRGTAERPGVLGRIVVTEGVLIFFGTKYTVNDATVSFYNPNKIEPIVNLSLLTEARGVQVTLNVTGPMNNLNLAYQSDPPLPFSEIVGLLAAGRAPTSDPVLVAQQPATPPQNFQQMGESALLSQAVSNPVAGQLQRVFGVSQLHIDPTFTSGSELPQARLTLQQQITSSLTFTYITNLTRSDPQIVRIDWTLSPQWSLIATRDYNGLFGVDFFYKRRFR